MMPDKERRKNRGVSITKPELRFDKFMDTVSRSKLGNVFAAITGISLVVASADSACANAQPTTKPAETAPVPSGTPTEVSTEVPTETKVPTMTATVTNTETPSLTPTPEGPDYNRAFFDPQSEADFPKVIEAPSPIDDPADFAVWQDGYLAAITEKLKTYTGPSIDGAGTVGIGPFGIFTVESKNWPVIASYKFIWNGQEMLTKTLVWKDSQGNLIPVSITYTIPTNGILFDVAGGYKTPPSDRDRAFGFRFAWDDQLRKDFSDKFAESFLPADDAAFGAQYRVWAGKGTAADRDALSRSRFIWMRFDRN